MTEHPKRILEAGCGTGRNLAGLLRSGARVYAVDMDFDAVATARGLIQSPVFFSAARMERLPFRDLSFDAIHCIDVLHWAPGRDMFEAMWMDCWRALRFGGSFFATLRTGGAEWFHPESALLDALVQRCGGEWILRSDVRIELRKREEP